MNRLNRGNVQSIRTRNVPAVLEMPTRTSRLSRHRNNIVQMPSRSLREENRSNVVIEMPLPANTPEPAAAVAPLHANAEALYRGFQIAMMALAALLGWPHPTRDNDPGPASAARPWRVERLSAVGRRHLSASVAQFPGCSVQVPAASAPHRDAVQLPQAA
jgi:hypothetical protein